MKIQKATISAQSYMSTKNDLGDIIQQKSATIENTIIASLSFFQQLKERFQGDFDNYHQFASNSEKGLSPGEGGGHEHIHATIVPLSPELCSKLTQLNKNYQENGPFQPSLTATDETMEPYLNQMDEQISPLPSDQTSPYFSFVLAAYYMDGVPSKIFRFRLYSLEPTTVGTKALENDCSESSLMNVLLKIYTVDPSIMSQIRANSGKPDQWENIIQNLLLDNYNDNDEGSNNTEPNHLFQLLNGCNVLWTPHFDTKRHSYLFDGKDYHNITNTTDGIDPILHDGSFHAIMLNETGAIVDSMISPGKKIRIQDELSLWGEPSSALWINDRGFDSDTGNFIYGNRKGLPYKMDRVASFRPLEDKSNSNDDVDISSTKIGRYLVQDGPGKEILWTLGPDNS